ncbi:transposase [Paraburkholderia sediminicola]|uniref:transposase n=1 Tax=Paraburkholderia sediminicola TaxID=458836 RepID=UPI0038B78D4A
MIEIPLTDADWERVKHLFSDSGARTSRGPGRPRRDVRGIVDAILWIEQTEEKWHRLPSIFPPAQTCYPRYTAWRKLGIIQLAVDILTISAPAVTFARDLY